MKILMISHYILHGNARSLKFGQSLSKLGHDVTNIAMSRHSRLKFRSIINNGVKVIETPDLFWGRARTGWDPWDTILRLIKTYEWANDRPDVIHGFECRPVTIFPILNLIRKQKDLVFISDWNDWWGRGGLITEQRPSWYTPIFGPIETYFEEAFRKRADGVTVISTALAERAYSLGVDKERICRISGGVDTDFFRPLPMKVARKELGIPQNIKLAVFSAGEVIIDLELVLLAFAKVCKQLPDAKLLLTGRKSPLTWEIAQRHGIEDKILDLGWVTFQDFPKYLACADIFLLPFRNKIANVGRWPNKAGEYMSVGRPIVSNPVGDIKELFDRENIGLLAREDPEDFAEKIISLFDNPELCEELGNNARRVAEEQFEWPVLTKRLEEFYYKFITGQ